jgi:hypothetical protein
MVIQKAMLRNQNTNLVTCRSEARGWTQILARYRTPSPTRSIIELVITAGPLILLWFLMWVTLDLGYWVCLFLAVPTAGFLVRLFMIQHDCGHGGVASGGPLEDFRMAERVHRIAMTGDPTLFHGPARELVVFGRAFGTRRPIDEVH